MQMDYGDAWLTNVNDNGISDACQGRSASQGVDRAALNGADRQLQQQNPQTWQDLLHKLCVRLDAEVLLV